MLFIVDNKKKYDIERSHTYLGYKLLFIIKTYLEGRQFPYGSLSQDKQESYCIKIGQMIIMDNEFLNEFLEFDSKCFLDIIQKLFYGDPFTYINM